VSESDSAIQLRREASKARALANAAFGIEEQRRLYEVAAILDREAAVAEASWYKAQDGAGNGLAAGLRGAG